MVTAPVSATLTSLEIRNSILNLNITIGIPRCSILSWTGGPISRIWRLTCLWATGQDRDVSRSEQNLSLMPKSKELLDFHQKVNYSRSGCCYIYYTPEIRLSMWQIAPWNRVCNVKSVSSLVQRASIGVCKTMLWPNLHLHFCSSRSCSSDAEGSLTALSWTSWFLWTSGTSSCTSAGEVSLLFTQAVEKLTWSGDTSPLAPLSAITSLSWSEGWGRLAMSSWKHQHMSD